MFHDFRVKLTVVALLALGAVSRHVTIGTARVACLAAATTTTTSTTTAATAVATTVSATSTTIATAKPASLSTIARNVPVLATLVAFLARGCSSTGSARCFIGAIARDVTRLSAAVAGSILLRRALLLWLLAFAAQVTFATAIVAGRVALGGTVASLMCGFAACKE